MRHSSLLLALSSFYAASALAVSCAPNYATIVTQLDDSKPAQTLCVAQHGTPTTTSVISLSTSSAPAISASSSLRSTLTPPSARSFLAARRLSADPTEDGCTDGPYAGTGTCQCSYNVLCGMSGDCGGDDETVVTALGSWQACGELCDENSNCTAWVYSYGTGLCTEITGLYCSLDNFQTVEDPDSVSGVYDGGVDCEGVCSI